MTAPRPSGNLPGAGPLVASSLAVSLRMRRQHTHDTAAELRLRRALRDLGLGYRVNHAPLPGIRRTADVVFVGVRVAVYVDGCFWHGCPEHFVRPRANAAYWVPKIEANRARDAETDAILVGAGWVAVHIWEHEDPVDAAQRVVRIIGQRRRPR